MCIRDRDTVAARAENLGAENLPNVTLGPNSLGGEITTTRSSVPVSYTHLDVYKRQVDGRVDH